MARAWQLVIKARGDVRDGRRGFKTLSNDAKRFESSTIRSFKRVAAGASLVLGAGVAVGLKRGFDELIQGDKVLRQTEAALRSTGGAANVSAGYIASMATSLQSVTGVGDEMIQSGQNILLTFTGIRNEVGAGNQIFDQATKAALDMSVALGQDMTSAAMNLGKALNDPAKGISKLSRVGVVFTDQQKKQVEALMKSGRTMGAQKIILAELNKEFGGSAKAYGESYAGMIDKIKNNFDEWSASIVQKALPAIDSIMKRIKDSAQPTRGLGQILRGLGDAWYLLKAAVVDAAKAFLDGYRSMSGGKGTTKELTTEFRLLMVRVGELAQTWLPRLGKIIGQVTGFLVDHRGSIASVLKVIVPLYAATRTYLAISSGFSKMKAYGKGIAHLTVNLGNKIGKLREAARAMSLASLKAKAHAAASRVAAAASKAWASVKLAASLLKTAAAATASKVATIASSVAMRAAAASTKAWAIATKILNVALRMNPIGLVISGISLLVGGLILAYKKSDRFRAIVNKVWDAAKKLGAYLKNKLASAVSFIGDKFAALKDKLSPVYDLMKKIFSYSPAGIAARAAAAGARALTGKGAVTSNDQVARGMISSITGRVMFERDQTVAGAQSRIFEMEAESMSAATMAANAPARISGLRARKKKAKKKLAILNAQARAAKGKKLAPIKKKISATLKEIRAIDQEIEKISGVVESWQDTVTQNAEAILSEQEFIEDTTREARGLPSIAEEVRTRELNRIRSSYGLGPMSDSEASEDSSFSGIGIGVSAGAFSGSGYMGGSMSGGTVVVNQNFSGEPNMAVAAQSAAWEFKGIMSAMPLGGAA